MSKITGVCTICQKDIEDDALELGSAEVIEVAPDEYELNCFDCAEKYREHINSLEEDE
jgi:hypothetical protein